MQARDDTTSIPKDVASSPATAPWSFRAPEATPPQPHPSATENTKEGEEYVSAVVPIGSPLGATQRIRNLSAFINARRSPRLVHHPNPGLLTSVSLTFGLSIGQERFSQLLAIYSGSGSVLSSFDFLKAESSVECIRRIFCHRHPPSLDDLAQISPGMAGKFLDSIALGYSIFM
jgi:hypothetical protein